MKEATRYLHPGMLSTGITPSTCPRCGIPVWHAHANGLPTIVEPQPITLLDELRARINHRTIYQTLRIGQQQQLVWRTVAHIRNHTDNVHLLVEHTCGISQQQDFPDLNPTTHRPQPDQPEF